MCQWKEDLHHGGGVQRPGDGRTNSFRNQGPHDVVQRENVGRWEMGTRAGSAEVPGEGLRGELKSLHFIPQVTRSLLSREFETFFKGARNGLRKPRKAEVPTG